MKHLVYFTAADHCVYSWAGGRLALQARFPGDDTGVTAFREYLAGRRGALFYAMADLAGEDFHEEQIPYLRGGDREQVVQALEASDARALATFPRPPRGVRAPLVLRNPWWAQPFEVFTRLVGMPSASGADPSVLLALAVPLI